MNAADLLRAELAKAEAGDDEAHSPSRIVAAAISPRANPNPVPLNGTGVLRAALGGGHGTINGA